MGLKKALSTVSPNQKLSDVKGLKHINGLSQSKLSMDLTPKEPEKHVVTEKNIGDTFEMVGMVERRGKY